MDFSSLTLIANYFYSPRRHLLWPLGSPMSSNLLSVGRNKLSQSDTSWGTEMDVEWVYSIYHPSSDLGLHLDLFSEAGSRHSSHTAHKELE